MSEPLIQRLNHNMQFDNEELTEFCARWRIRELAVFGSALREDFGPDSDVDVLVTLEKDVPWSLFDWMDMIEQLKQIFGRDVDLVEKTAIRNPFRRNLVLKNHRVLYAA